jgi:hypothetical protein
LPKHGERLAAIHREMQEEVRLLLNLEQPLARAADGPEPWATDVQDLVGLVRSLSSDLVAAEDELARLRQDLASRDDSA